MAIRESRSTWEGGLRDGHGTMALGVDGPEMRYGFGSRFEDGAGSNPEELIAGAHAGCFSMALAHALGEAGHAPERIRTTARVHLQKTDAGFAIPRIELRTAARVPGIEDAAFQEIARDAKENCPVSKLLSSAEIALEAKLSGS